MPIASKNDKFFYYKPSTKGWRKGKGLIGLNLKYEGNIEDLNFQDLIDFLKEKNIDPKKVLLSSNFTTTFLL
jgi:hypothetical protein